VRRGWSDEGGVRGGCEGGVRWSCEVFRVEGEGAISHGGWRVSDRTFGLRWLWSR